MVRTHTPQRRMIISICFVVFAVSASAQSRTPSVSVVDPPEMLGPPPPPFVVDPLDKEFFESIKEVKGDFTRDDITSLEAFIAKHPDYRDGYYWHAQAKACSLKPPDLSTSLDDLNQALSRKTRPERNFKDSEVYSITAKIELSQGKTGAALKSITAAMMSDLDSAESIFNISGVKPQTTSDFCTWNLTDLDSLKRFAPHDWHPVAFEGLYYKFFTSFDQSFSEQAEPFFEKAALIDPHSAIPVYLLAKTVAKSGFMSIKAASSDAYRDQQYRRAIQLFTKAIAIDPTFTQAYSGRAEIYLNRKQNALAIRDFDRVISSEPDSTEAHSDRGIAEQEIGQYGRAINDFDFSLEKEKPGDIYVPQLYENRADAYMSLRNPRRAVEDYSSAIRSRLQGQLSLLSLSQFRRLYPEYDPLSDDNLLERITKQFIYGSDTSKFRKMLRENDGKWAVSLLNDLYEKRGSAYIGLGDFRRGIMDYQRIYKGMSNFANSTERWQPLGEFSHTDQYFLDVKASDLAGTTPLIWVKAESLKGTEIMAFDVDCSDHRMRQSSSTRYNQKKAVIGSSENGGWFPITPDTLGEQLWNGMCANQ